MRMVKEAGCDAVKLEGGGPPPRARARDHRRRHSGDGPRRADAADLHRARRLEGAGPHRAAAARIASEALALQGSRLLRARVRGDPERGHQGADAPPRDARDRHRRRAGTDGQVLVFHDLLGIRDGLGPRFVKRYANIQQEMNAGVSAYAEDVRTRRYPGPEHTSRSTPASSRSCRHSCAEFYETYRRDTTGVVCAWRDRRSLLPDP